LLYPAYVNDGGHQPPGARDQVTALLRLLQRLGRLEAAAAGRIERLTLEEGQPVAEVLEGEQVITQPDLAILLGEALELPLLARVRDTVTAPQTRTSAARIATTMLIEDALAQLADGKVPRLTHGARAPAAQPTSSPDAGHTAGHHH